MNVFLHDLVRRLWISEDGKAADQCCQADGEVLNVLPRLELEHLILAACLLRGGLADPFVADPRGPDAVPCGAGGFLPEKRTHHV